MCSARSCGSTAAVSRSSACCRRPRNSPAACACGCRCRAIPTDSEPTAIDGLGRLKPGVTVEQADADLLRAQQPIFDTRDKETVVTPFARDLRAQFTRDFGTIASTLGAAVSLLLIVACANVAALMLARALARRREIGIRLAVGASRARLLRQLLVENIMLSIAGGALGLADRSLGDPGADRRRCPIRRRAGRRSRSTRGW